MFIKPDFPLRFGSRSIALGLFMLLAANPVAEAGNILRMGGSGGAAPGAASASGGSGALIPASSPGAMAAHNLLSRTAQALAAVQNMQAAARATAQNLTTNYLVTHAGLRLAPVPDGLVDNRTSNPADGAGGLIPDNGIVPDPNNPGSYILSGTWTGVAALSQQPSTGGQTTVTVTQGAQQALLNWQTFNVGRHTTLHFNQTAGGTDVGKWIAFNKINSSGVPSQILGSIQAEGQVYVINPNGIIFGGSSQVNAHALVASSLPINDNLVQRGLLNNPDGQFLFSALSIPVLANGNGTAAFTPPTITGAYGDVEIQPGAQLSAPTTPEHVGGLVALIGPNVYNGGTINTPDGQSILAAGLQVGLAAHNTNDPTLRGLDVYVGAVADPAGIVTTVSSTAGTAENAEIDPTGAVTVGGDIEAPRADVTMTGQTVNQFGIINSSTSVAYNGRIDLLANYNAISNGLTPNTSNSIPLFLYQTTGAVTLGPGSVTQIVPELASTDRVVGTTLSLPSLVNIQGQSIHLQSDAAGDPGTGAVIFAPGAGIMPSLNELSITQPKRVLPEDDNYTMLGAGVSLTAGTWALNGIGTDTKTGLPIATSGAQANLIAVTSPASPPAANPNQISLDPGATIDVSGSQAVSASVAENIVAVQLQGAQLANSPLQRGGPFYHQTINVDIRKTGSYNGQEWVGTPLADTTGYVNLIQRSVGELSTNGGTVALNAGDAVTLSPNSIVNVSGGWIHYQGGVVSTTKVLVSGYVRDISLATPDLVYGGIYTGTFTTSDAKWGVTQTYTNPELGGGGQYEQSYDQGGNAGTIAITAPSIKLGSNSLFGSSAAGAFQRTPDAQVRANFKGTPIIPTMESILSVPATGSLSLFFQGETADGIVATPKVPDSPPDIYVQSPGNQTLGNPQPTLANVILSPNLVSQEGNGFGNLKVFDPDGNIFVLENVITPAGGSLDFTGKNIMVGNSTGNQVTVTAPSGTLSFTVNDVSPLATAPDVTLVSSLNTSAGQFTLNQGASLSTSGLVVDDRKTAAAPGTLPLFTDGGTISINAYRIDLSAGKMIDVSGGVEMNAAAKVNYGKGGNLSLNAVDPKYSALGLLPDTPINHRGQLLLGATLTGYSGQTGSGGTLNITAPFIQVGGERLINGDDGTANPGRTLWLNKTDANGDILPERDANGNLLAPEFFSRGGFSNFTLAGVGDFALDASGKIIPFTYMPGFVVAPNTAIAPQVSSWMATTPPGGQLTLTPTLLAVGQRTPASLAFSSSGNDKDFATNYINNSEGLRGDLVVYPGAVIQTDPLGSVTLNADKNKIHGTTVTMLGSIYAPGGNISINGVLSSDEINIPLFTPPTPSTQPTAPAQQTATTVDLGPNSVLDASGVTVLTPDTSGRNLRTGSILPGGTITVDGNIVAEAGATINVNGATSQFDEPQAKSEVNTAQNGNVSRSKVVRVREDSNGGSITLTGEEELFTMASLSGFAGGSTLPGGSMAQGGNLTVSSSFFGVASEFPTQPSLFLTQNITPFYVAGQTLTVKGQPVTVAGTPLVVSGFASGRQQVIGNPVVGIDGATAIPGGGYFAANSFNTGGFASLTLGGAVQFSGPVVLNASNRLTIGNTGILVADRNITTSSLTLNAPYVVLGEPFLAPVQSANATVPFSFNNNPTAVPPTYGSGSLIVNASDLIDIGSLSLQNIGTANFDATVNVTTGQSGQTNGAIRGDGTFDVAGAIKLKAGQIYPPTATTFNIAAYSYASPNSNFNFNILVAKSSTTTTATTNPTQVTLDSSYASNPLPSGFGIGSSLLGSTVTGINGLNVTLASAANATITTNTPSTPESYTNYSSVTILPGPSLPALPLSAGGTLGIYAPIISQGGVLRAPIGTINLGVNGNSLPDPITALSFPSTQVLTLASGSKTSVSAVDPVSGQALTLPYGINLNGISWIDPTGTDITVAGNGQTGVGLPAKTINFTAANVDDQAGSTIDLTGGGDLYAYRWVPGLGGSNDILNSTSSFAVIPGYSADYAPYAPYNGSKPKTGTNSLLDANSKLTDPGYAIGFNPDGVTPALSVGDQVYLGASNGLPAGTYTLLPARYALLPGAFLVTPRSGTPTGTVSRLDGSSLVSGYQFNHLTSTRPLLSSFEVDPQSVMRARAEYDDSSANSFLRQNAQAQKLAIPRLPVDAGQLVFTATQALNIAGSLAAQTPAGGRGSLVDINSPVDILIASPDGVANEKIIMPNFNGLVLDPNGLSNFGADSLLIGGIRSTTTSGTTVTVSTTNVTVDNAESPQDNPGNIDYRLTGPDVILAANQNLTLAPGADVEQGARMLSSPADTLQVGQTVVLKNSGDVFPVTNGGSAISFPNGLSTNDTLTANGSGGIVTPAGGGTPTTFSAGSSIAPAVGSTVTFNNSGSSLTLGLNSNSNATTVDPVSITIGDGALLRVSSDSSASIARSGVTGSTAIPIPNMTIWQGAKIVGASVTLDSTNKTSLDPSAILSGSAVNLDSGQISLQLPSHPGSLQATVGLVLSNNSLQTLQAAATSLSLLSYSSIDIYGTGPIGALDAAGQPTFTSLALHAGKIRGFNVGNDTATFAAKSILLDNSAAGTAPGSILPLGGSLAFNAGSGTITLGANQLAIDQYNAVNLTAGGGILVQGTGGLSTPGDLMVTTPRITGTTAAKQNITVGGKLEIDAGGSANITGGLGASLTLQGTTVASTSNIILPSGTLNLHATGGNVTIGAGGMLDVSGTAQPFFDATQYTSGGQITLTSDKGGVNLATDSTVNVSAPLNVANDGSRVGNAGSLTISAPTGSFNFAANTMFGQGGVGGQGGTFALDVSSLPSLVTLDSALDPVTGGTVLGGFTQSQTIRVRTGDVAVDGTVAAQTFNLSADQGTITVTGKIVATAAQNGTIDVNSDPTTKLLANPGQTGGTINLDASGSVILSPGSLLTVAGQTFNDAGKGGAVSLEAGSETKGTAPITGTRDTITHAFSNGTPIVDIQPGSKIDLSVASNIAPVVRNLDAGGTLSLGSIVPVGGNDFITVTNPNEATGIVIGTIQSGSGPNATTSPLYANVLTVVNGASSIALNPDSNLNGSTVTFPGSAALGEFTGTLHLRAPRTSNGTDVQVNPIPSDAISGASSVVVEGYKLYAPASGVIDTIDAVRGPVYNDANTFASATNTQNILTNLIRTSSSLLYHVQPGVEIVNPTAPGSITLSTNSSPLAPGASTQTTVPTTINVNIGSTVTLALNATNSSITIGSGGAVAFDSAGTIKATVAGTITKPDGTSSTLRANTTTTISAGSTVTFTGSSKVTFTNTSVASVSLASGGTISLIGANTTITNSTGNLALFNAWDLSNFRFGPNVNGGVPNGDGSGEPSILTLRAAGNLVFNYTSYNSSTSALTAGSLSDGFDAATTNIGSPANIGALYAKAALWTAQLMPGGSRSWSYNLAAGADLSAADSSRVLPGLAATTGSLLLGSGSPALQPASSGTFSDLAIIPKYYQVIRTGTGDINIFAGQDVQLLDPLATIYTAGSRAPALAADEFDVPLLKYLNAVNVFVSPHSTSASSGALFVYPAQYSQNGGNVTISAQHDISRYTVDPATGALVPNSSQEMPTNWLYRRGYVDPAGQFDLTHSSGAFLSNTIQSNTGNTEVASTTWWTDFSNFFEGVGALGGGNVTLLASHDVSNVDVMAPTNARATKQLPNSAGTLFTNPSDGINGATTGTYDQIAAHQALVELGGGDVTVNTGNNINGGVYYVERGSGTLNAGNSILTNSTRVAVTNTDSLNPITWLPTTLFLGKGSFDVTAGGNVLLGPVDNPFLLPQGINNSYFDKTYFSTYATTDTIHVSSLTGNVTLRDNPDSAAPSNGTLINWYQNILEQKFQGAANQQPWLSSVETSLSPYFTAAAALMPGTLQATAFSGDLNLAGSLTLSPSPNGTVELAAAGSINGFQPSSVETKTLPSGSTVYLSALNSTTINLSDASPSSLPGIYTPLSLTAAAIAATGPNSRVPGGLPAKTQAGYWDVPPTATTTVLNGPTSLLPNFSTPFVESGSFTGSHGVLQTQQALHGANSIPLHANDHTGPIQLFARTGDISGLTVFSGKAAQVVAGNDITDIALYLQNDNSSDVSAVEAGRDLIAYDSNSSLRIKESQIPGNEPLSDAASNLAGDIQISGPGTLEVLTGRNLNLGIGPNNQDGTAVGITSIGNARNPALPFTGADVIAGAGLSGLAAFNSNPPGLANGQMDFTQFNAQFPIPASGNAEQQDIQALTNFYLVLRDAGRNHGNPSSPGFKNYHNGFAAIAALFPGNAWQGDISLTSRDIKTDNGGNISILAPGGQLTVGLPAGGVAADQGILTVHGGDISIFTNGNVNVGISRIFTLLGGNEIIWSSTGNIAAGSASKTVQSAPPTRVLVDPQSGNIEPDLAGLATGGGIGALETVVGVPPANIDLIAPAGFIDAGDAGIRASGNLNISAVQVLNASNIQVGGKSTGTPAPPVAPNVASIASASNTNSASSNAAAEVAKQGHGPIQQQVFPSIITVEVLGYGGGDS